MTELDTEFAAFENAVENPESLVKALETLQENEAPPEIADPTDGPVRLPGGFRRFDGSRFEEVTEAWVTELDGEAEERIARTRLKNDYPAFQRAILESGVERIGTARPTKDDFDSLLLGDQQYLLLEIARATYGDELTFSDFVCPHCGAKFDVSLSLAEDVPVKRLEKPEDASFEVHLRKDRVAAVNLPTSEVSAMLSKAETSAETNTVLVANCVSEIRGPKGVVSINGDEAIARKLGVVDRDALVVAMGERMPGPRYNEVTFKHDPGCGEEIRLEVTLADLFRGM